jgi:transcriptional regulator with XRE-family HTH domain
MRVDELDLDFDATALLRELHVLAIVNKGVYSEYGKQEVGSHPHQTVFFSSMSPRTWRNQTRVREVLAHNVITRRQARNLTAPELALLAGVSRTQIHYVEHGRKAATVDFIAAAATALRCEPWELLLPGSVAAEMNRAGMLSDAKSTRSEEPPRIKKRRRVV